MTWLEFWSSGSGANLIVSGTATLAALTMFLKSRSIPKTLHEIHLLVNGQSTRKDERIQQLEEFISEQELPIPPSLPPLPPDNGEVPIILPSQQDGHHARNS